MRLLIVVDRTWPCDHSFLEEVLARELPARGHEVLFIMSAAAPEHVGTARWHGARVEAIRAGSRPALAWKARQIARRYAAEQHTDWILVRNEVLAAYLLSFSSRVPVAFQLSHMKEETAILQGRHSGGTRGLFRGVSARLSRLFRRRVMRRVPLVLPVSAAMAEELQRTGERIDRMLVTPLGAVPGELPQLSVRETVRDRLGVPGQQLLLLYMGTLNRLRRLDTLIHALSLIRAEGIDAALVYLGDGPGTTDRTVLEQAAAESGVGDQTLFVRSVPRREVPQYLVAADLGLSYFPDEPLFRQNSPIKVMEYLAAGLPVVCTRQPEQEMLIDATMGGVVADGYSARAIADALATAAGTKWERPAIRRRFGQLRSYSSIADTLERELQARLVVQAS